MNPMNANPPSYTDQLQAAHNRENRHRKITALVIGIMAALVLAGAVYCTVTGGLAFNSNIYGPGIVLAVVAVALLAGTVVNGVKARRQFIPPSQQALITALTRQEAPVPVGQIADNDYRILLGVEGNAALRAILLTDARRLNHVNLLSDGEVTDLLVGGHLTVDRLADDRYAALLGVQNNDQLRRLLIGDPRRLNHVDRLGNDEVIRELVSGTLQVNQLTNDRYAALLGVQDNAALRAILLIDARRLNYCNLLSRNEVIHDLLQGNLTVDQLANDRYRDLLGVQNNGLLRRLLIGDPRRLDHVDSLSLAELTDALEKGQLVAHDLPENRYLALLTVKNEALRNILLRDPRGIIHFLENDDFEELRSLHPSRIDASTILQNKRIKQLICVPQRVGVSSVECYLRIAFFLNSVKPENIDARTVGWVIKAFREAENQDKIAILGLFKKPCGLLRSLLKGARLQLEELDTEKLKEVLADQQFMKALAAHPGEVAWLFFSEPAMYPGDNFYLCVKAVFDRVEESSFGEVEPYLRRWSSTAFIGQDSIKDLLSRLRGVPAVLKAALQSHKGYSPSDLD